MFWCDKCNVQRIFDHTDYYGFDIYVCPKCSGQVGLPADGYGEPDDDDIDDEEYFDEPGEDDDFLWDEDDDLLDDGVYEGDVVIHQPYDDEDDE